MFLTTFLSTVEVAALSYERKEKGGEEEGETKGGKRRELRDRYVDQISSVSAHNNCGFHLFAKGRKRKEKGEFDKMSQATKQGTNASQQYQHAI